MTDPPIAPTPSQWDALELDDQLAICHRDLSRGGVETDATGFLLEPFGECILSDTYVALGEMV